MKRDVEILTRRYAQAYVHLFRERLSFDAVQKLPAIAALLEQHRSLLIFAGLHDTKEKTLVQIVELFTLGGFDESLSYPLINLLASHNRLKILPWVAKKIYDEYLEAKGIMHFTIESAVPLHDDEREAFVAFLRKKTGKQILYSLVVNPTLIAGVKMYSNTLGFEHSIRQRLYELACKPLST